MCNGDCDSGICSHKAATATVAAVVTTASAAGVRVHVHKAVMVAVEEAAVAALAAGLESTCMQGGNGGQLGAVTAARVVRHTYGSGNEGRPHVRAGQYD